MVLFNRVENAPFCSPEGVYDLDTLLESFRFLGEDDYE